MSDQMPLLPLTPPPSASEPTPPETPVFSELPPEPRRSATRPPRQFRSHRRAEQALEEASPIAFEPLDPLDQPARPTSQVLPRRQAAPKLPPAARWVALGLLALLLVWGGSSGVRWVTAHQAELRARAIELADRTTHPLFYRDLIEQNAETFALDPALIAAITLCESSFDPQATSRVSARGLMQLMPDTAEWIAGKVDTPNYSFDLLFDPATNLQYGSWYLGYLSRRFDGDAKKIVCAYHAGQGNVDAWLKNPKYSPDGVTLATIPTKDTNAYATRVLRALDIYQRYYFPPEVPAEEPADALPT